MKNGRKPILAVTMGDATGTGPELLTKGLTDPEVGALCRPVVIGDAAVMQAALDITKIPAAIRVIPSPAQADDAAGVIHVVDLANLDATKLVHGRISPRAGQAAYEYINRAVELTLQEESHAVVTSAINKGALHEAGHNYDGHTELLAKLCGGPKVTMMLVADKLRICHVSTHVALREAIERARPDRIVSVIKIARAGVQELGIANPHIAVAGLNPHAGEGGIFGDEEIKFIAPAIEQARSLGFRVSGPLAGDTVFFRTLQGEFDCAIAMYHDQGHVAAKMLGIWLGVNVTLGLPIIRTSVEHGTDFVHAGTGRGDPRSLVAALKLAATIATNRLRATGSAINRKTVA